MKTSYPHRHRGVILLAVALLAVSSTAEAENWPSWRGPTGVGLTAAKDLPLKWNGKTGENVLWKTPLTGTTGHSSPIVWGDRVFITTAAKQTREQEARKEIPEHHIVCFQVADGKQLWSTRIEPGKELAGYAIYASPTPVTDGKAVYAWFGSAVIAAVDFDGKLLWRHERAGPFYLNPGITSSPILYEDTVLLISDQGRGNGFLQALDKKTGTVKWEKKRKDSSYCNATPFLMKVAGKTQLIVPGSNVLQALNPGNGDLIWSCKAWEFGASPVHGGGLIYADRGGNEPAVAIAPGGMGDVTATRLKWKLDKVPGEYASPVISGDYIYRAAGEGRVQCLRLATGEQLFAERLEGLSKLASPIATADGRVYFVSAGTSYVLKAGPKLEVLAKNTLGGDGNNGSSPAVAAGRIFVRDFDFLYCLGTRP